MRSRLVTAYVPLVDHPRPPAEYGALGEKLGGAPVRKKAFYQRVEETWLYDYAKSLPFLPKISVADNPAKNTLAYHCIQHEKIEWLCRAADEYPEDDVVVWVDYGIFHQPRVCNEAIYNFMERVDDSAIYAPGCWSPRPDVVGSEHPCWRFCGSVLAVPTKYVHRLALAVRNAAVRHITLTRNIEWEVNTWARVEGTDTGLPWHWYHADHDVSQFTNLPGLTNA